MCGICGIVAPGRPPETETVERMATELDHRGPDGTGSFAGEGVALGFRRLAIIDLSEAGMQPFASDDGSLSLMHNGEVYNYRELRRELEALGHRFRSATDTEVILAAYREWGERCVERFNGMWAFALWDGPRRRLFASRDRFGVKPFYYRLDGDPPAAAERRAARHRALRRARLVGDRGHRRPLAAHRGRERGRGRAAPAHVHRLLRSAGLRRATLRARGRRADERRGALDLLL